MLQETIKLALQALQRNTLRSFLTVLGIVIGVGAVIAMVTIGRGTTAKVTADLSKLGSNMLFVRPGQATMGLSGARSEIGIRLAVGALERHVLLQFLVEGVVLSLFGGVVGIVLGLTLAAAAAQGLQVPFVFDPVIILVAFLFSAVVGVIFGFLPARRAARLDPIEAPRHE